MVSDEKSVLILIAVPLEAFRIFNLSSVFRSVVMTHLGVQFFEFILCVFTELLES